MTKLCLTRYLTSSRSKTVKVQGVEYETDYWSYLENAVEFIDKNKALFFRQAHKPEKL